VDGSITNIDPHVFVGLCIVCICFLYGCGRFVCCYCLFLCKLCGGVLCWNWGGLVRLLL
jgi:hypothetical protein